MLIDIPEEIYKELQAIAEATQQPVEEVLVKRLKSSLALPPDDEACAKAIIDNRMRSAFITSISHELRAPLNSIIGYCDLLLNGIYGTLNEQQQSKIQCVYDYSQQLRQMINDMIDLSRIASGRMESQIETFHLDRLIRNTIQSMHPLAIRNHNEIIVNIPAEPIELY